ncbi:MAG: hypothetical protein R3C45_13985 [Phycisphaerales bacterium]
MRSKRFMRCLAVLAALTLTLWLVSPTSAETGCHKTKGKGGSDTKAVQTIS